MSEQPPIPPQPLSYRSLDPVSIAAAKAKRWKFIRELLAGGGSWIALCLISGLTAGFAQNPVPAIVMMVLGFVALIAFGVKLKPYSGMRGFLPGLFIGVALTCLVPLGIIGVLCAANR